MTTKRKCKALSLAEKRKIIEEVALGVKKKKDIAAEFGIPANTLSTIIKNKDLIMSAKEKALGPFRKRLKSSRFPGVEEEMVKWLKFAVDNNMPISGIILKEKAEEFAIQRGYSEFKASSGWLDKFKNRNGMVHTTGRSESATVSANDCDDWRREVLPQLLQTYHPNDVFNVDETLLYYKTLPDKTLDRKNEKCQVGKVCRDRVTVILCTNSTGMEKLKLLVIGKSKKPRCFAGVKSLPVFYESNKKSQMTSNIFQNWLREMDQKFHCEKRKILLFAANNPVHEAVLMKELTAIKVVLLPRNITCTFQTMEQGIIKSLKHNYRKGTELKLLQRIDAGEIFDITLLDCVLELDKAWHAILPGTILSCFKKVGIDKWQNEREERGEDEAMLLEDEWPNLKKHVKMEATFDEYANVDCDVIVTEYPVDAENVIRNGDTVEPIEDNEEDASADKLPLPPTVHDAMSAFDTVKSYILSQENITDNIFHSVRNIESFLVFQQRNVQQF